MKKVVFGFILAVGALAGAAAAGAEEPSDAEAFRKVLTNTARGGYEAALLNWDAATIVLEELLSWSRRVLEAESGKYETRGFEPAAARAHLKRIERLRRKVDVSDSLQAAQTDFEYQLARAIVAASDAGAKDQWQADIRALSRLQGQWKEVRGERIGSSPELGEVVLEITGGVGRSNLTADGFIALDAKKSPAEIRFFGRNYDYYPTTVGIFEMDGDSLRLACRRNLGDEAPRPTNFSPGKDADFVVYTFRRVKPASDPDR